MNKSYEGMNQVALRAACVAQGVKITHAGGRWKTLEELVIFIYVSHVQGKKIIEFRTEARTAPRRTEENRGEPKKNRGELRRTEENRGRTEENRGEPSK